MRMERRIKGSKRGRRRRGSRVKNGNRNFYIKGGEEEEQEWGEDKLHILLLDSMCVCVTLLLLKSLLLILYRRLKSDKN